MLGYVVAAVVIGVFTCVFLVLASVFGGLRMVLDQKLEFEKNSAVLNDVIECAGNEYEQVKAARKPLYTYKYSKELTLKVTVQKGAGHPAQTTSVSGWFYFNGMAGTGSEIRFGPANGQESGKEVGGGRMWVRIGLEGEDDYSFYVNTTAVSKDDAYGFLESLRSRHRGVRKRYGVARTIVTILATGFSVVATVFILLTIGMIVGASAS